MKTEAVKDLLGRALSSADDLASLLNDGEVEKAKTNAEEWGKQTRDLVTAAYGSGEGALFLDDSGYVFYSDGSDKAQIRNWIQGRVRRIGELLRRADSL